MTPRAQNLQETNRRLRCWLDRMAEECGRRRPALPEDISALLSELLLVGAGLRAEAIPPRGTETDLDRELDCYRRNIEQLRQLLPSIHGQLLAERARIETQRSRIASAEQWAKASRQTL